MRFIKKFEELDFSQTLPIASRNALTNYYHCDCCNALWKEVNKQHDRCKFCKSDEIEELSEDEWYDTVKGRLDEDEIEGMDEDRLRGENEFLDLSELGEESND